MKALVCELCGSNEFVKEDGFFVCQHCHTKYSPEEAKKIMVEGTVDVSGSTVKVDNTAELQNLYELARRARSDNNSENAQKYYEQILMKDPSSWEANFYSTYYQSMNCKIGQIQSAAIRMSNCEKTVLNLIKDNVIDPEERKVALNEVGSQLGFIAGMLFKAAYNHYYGIGDSIREQYKQEMVNNCSASRDICYNYGDYVIEIFGDEYGKDIAAPIWELGITMHNKLMPMFLNKEFNKEIIMGFADKIKKYNPSYEAPKIDTSNQGCYVATAVYGSYDCPEVWTLRRFRDNILAETWYGRAFIHTYYAISPSLVKWFGKAAWFKNLWKPMLDSMVRDLQSKGVENTPYEDRK